MKRRARSDAGLFLWFISVLYRVSLHDTVGCVIRSFRHKGIEAFFLRGTTRGIPAAHQDRLRRQLLALNQASAPHDMNAPGWKLHPLKGKLANHWAVSVSGNWRLTFKFEDGDAILVDYQDYH